uniref:Retrotransposon protein, putative, unclassified n=1 Tax=Caenorhabditis tropicalis TaxID=1561998 RepID=A0A1I7U9T0_9PELO
MRNLDEKEAETQLLDILVKATIVESHLMFNGKQNAKELFERMRFPNKGMFGQEEEEEVWMKPVWMKPVEAVIPPINGVMVPDSDDEVGRSPAPAPCPDLKPNKLKKAPEYDIPEKERENYEQAIPFTSPEDLSKFLHEMIPMFRYCPATEQWQNTGVETRRFIQWLKTEMEGGHEFSLDNFETIDYPRFTSTIKETNERLRQFAEKELFMDYPFLDDIELHVPGFCYDLDTEILSLSPEASSRLTLNLPILQKLVNSNTGHFMDCSRDFSTFVTPWLSGRAGRSYQLGLTGVMKGLVTIAYTKKFNIQRLSTSFLCPLISVSGYLWPGSTVQHGEIYTMEAAHIDQFQTVTENPPGYDITENGDKTFGTFESSRKYMFNEDRFNKREKNRLMSDREAREKTEMHIQKWKKKREELEEKLKELMEEKRQWEGMLEGGDWEKEQEAMREQMMKEREEEKEDGELDEEEELQEDKDQEEKKIDEMMEVMEAMTIQEEEDQKDQKTLQKTEEAPKPMETTGKKKKANPFDEDIVEIA